MTIYKQAIEYFGENHQIIKSIEELSELQSALARYLINQNNYQNILNIYEEIADNENMFEQLKIIFSCRRIVKGMRKIKNDRLEKRIKGNE